MTRGAQDPIASLDAAVPAESVSTCSNCGNAVVFKPYYLDGKESNPPIWFHPPGSVTCSTKPKGWRVGWPTATPADQTSTNTEMYQSDGAS
jgi:hypothetical protein